MLYMTIKELLTPYEPECPLRSGDGSFPVVLKARLVMNGDQAQTMAGIR